ncbi:hypothetical protein [Peptostreptococcus faecalis]|uniref:hypothetical protein n=1 Tax=Peptostreptococcus faecalis TaxID=2045015 RepID=UPI000C79AEB9|nr:hypothetical protein [Peptostreptococcus faecalis]
MNKENILKELNTLVENTEIEIKKTLETALKENTRYPNIDKILFYKELINTAEDIIDKLKYSEFKINRLHDDELYFIEKIEILNSQLSNLFSSLSDCFYHDFHTEYNCIIEEL